MSSKKKTRNLNLNMWASTDIPQMSDFNSDNVNIETGFTRHSTDINLHIASDERQRWDSPCYCGSYTGNGASSRTIETHCGFVPSFGLVFAASMPPSAVDFNNKVKRGFFGVFTAAGGTTGISASQENFTVTNNTSSSNGDYISLNQSGVIYHYALFR